MAILERITTVRNGGRPFSDGYTSPTTTVTENALVCCIENIIGVLSVFVLEMVGLVHTMLDRIMPDECCRIVRSLGWSECTTRA
jgi:hypothetical protein